MSPTALIDELLKALAAERRINPGADLLRAQEVCCETVRILQRRSRRYCGVCGSQMLGGECPRCDAPEATDPQPCAYCGVFDKEVQDGEVISVESGRCNVCARATSMGAEMMPTKES